MLKILVVEDEAEKRRLIAQIIFTVSGIDQGDVEYADDVVAAKRSIKKTRFDLVILDINLPERADLHATTGAGLEVLKFIKHNGSAKTPGYVVGMTAHDDAAAVASEEFASPLWKLVRFSYSEPTWQEPLRQALAYLVEKHQPPYVSDGHTFHTDLGIMVALENEELRSVLDLPAEWKSVNVPHDHASYFRGTFYGSHGTLSVVAVAAPKMGMPPAAVTAAKLIQTFRPRTIAIAGICAGVRGKAEIGDILVADPCFDWGSGKWILDASSRNLKFRPAPYQWRLDERLRSGVRAVATKPNLLSEIHAGYKEEKPSQPPKVLVEAMASGASVLQASSLMDDVRDQHKNLVGVEMESYAVFTAAEYASEPRPQCISIKSVCDFGDELKSDAAHEYAAYTSARFLYEFAIERLIEE